jgi:hypothetical protein
MMLREKIPYLVIVFSLIFSLPAIMSLLGIEVDEKACRKICNLHPVAAICWLAMTGYGVWVGIQDLSKFRKFRNKKTKKTKHRK